MTATKAFKKGERYAGILSPDSYLFDHWPSECYKKPDSFNMNEIHDQIFKAIEEQDTIRIIADVPTDRLRPEDYLASASDFIKPFMMHWGEKHMVRHLVVDVYPRHAYIVIDVNNRQYDYDTAHKQTYPVPIYILRLSRRGNKWIFFRRPVDDQRIATILAELHWCNGQNPLPFLADHIKGSVYTSPRMT